MLQVLRLFLESNLRRKKIRPTISATIDNIFGLGHTNSIASSPIEDESPRGGSPDDDSSVVDQDSPLEPLMRHEESSGQDSSSSSKKLTRQPAFKINRKSFDTHETPTGYNRYAARPEVTDKQFYQLFTDGDGEKQDETGYASLQEEHTMLQQMYDKAIEENDRLKDANTFMQQKLTTLVNARHYQVFGSISSGETNAVPDAFDCENKYNKIYYEEMSFDQLNNLPNKSFEINTCDHGHSFGSPSKDISPVLETNNKRLEAENCALRDELSSLQDQLKEYERLTIENDKKHAILEQELKSAEDHNNELLNQVVYLCSTLDVVKHLEATKRSPVNTDELAQLESELFFMIDQNVRYESALMEIKFKVTKHMEKVSIDTLASNKSESSQNETTTNGDHQKTSINNNTGTNKTKRSISSRASTSRASSPLVKKSSEMKKEHRKTVKSIRKENNDHPVSLAKEIKTCRTSRTKELLQERLLMAQRITSLEEEIVTKDKELEKNVLHVELLTKELGQIDLESMDTGIESSNRSVQSDVAPLERQSTFVKDDSNDEKKFVVREKSKNCVDVSIPLRDNEDIEIIEIPEVKYEDLMAFVQHGKGLSSPLGPGIDSLSRNDRNRLLEREIKSQIVSLERANECLRESNVAVSEELHLVRSLNRDQKDKIKELRFEISTAVSEAQALRYQLSQNQYRFENAKLRYEKQISTMTKQVAQMQTNRHQHHDRQNFGKTMKKLSTKLSQKNSNAALSGSF